MRTKSSGPQASRRAFLKGVALVGGTTVLVSVTAAVAETADGAEPPQQENATASQGYRVTSHIKTYYDRAGF